MSREIVPISRERPAFGRAELFRPLAAIASYCLPRGVTKSIYFSTEAPRGE
jgi:hypothetical protein